MPDSTACELRTLRLTSDSTACSEAIGAALGRQLQPGDVICLSGMLGAGKTVFSRGIGQGWGAVPALSSPTYNLVHQHRRAQDEQQLAHIDLYRIRSAGEADTVGIDDLLDSETILILEWPERIRERLPQAHLWIDIELVDDEQRELVFHPQGSRYAVRLNTLQRDLQATG